MITRRVLLVELSAGSSVAGVVVLTGLRQCGKTTLARELLSQESVTDPTGLSYLTNRGFRNPFGP